MIFLTGASSGIGKEIIKPLSDLDNIIGIYYKNKPRIKSLPKNCKFYKLDLTNREETSNFINSKIKKEKKLIIINLASIKKDSLLLNQDINDIKKSFELNFFAPLRLAQLVLPIMIRRNWGRFIFFSSTGGEKGDIGTASYTSSKLALSGISKIISMEYGGFNITSNLIKLGFFNAGMYKKLSKLKQKELMNLIPSKKLGNFQNIFLTIKLFIESEYINGAEVNIDGGMRR